MWTICYTYANVMQQIDNSSCDVFTIAYAKDIAFGLISKNFNMFWHKCEHIYETT